MSFTVDLVLNNNFFKIYMTQSNPVTTGLPLAHLRPKCKENIVKKRSVGNAQLTCKTKIDR